MTTSWTVICVFGTVWAMKAMRRETWHLAGICPQDLIQALEQRTFPHAVIPQDRQELPLLQGKAHVLQNVLAAVVMVGDMVYFYHFRVPPLNRRYRNRGPPKKEVMAPMGRMMGIIATRAKRSPSRSRTAPARTEPGMR